MGNYCILNGINSNELTGLLVSSLPPISKPLMRTQIETIDGRDGDIVTNLGYSAYDKKMEIGLYGDYDIDEIIAFFASEGTVTFSNEPDKYYHYTIVDQIDYERLIRYRKATVTFHCQPYKYDATETEIDYTNTYTEDTEPYIYRANRHDANMMKLKKVVGGTIAWNQLIEKKTGAMNLNIGTKTYDTTTNTFTISLVTPSINFGLYSPPSNRSIANHKYLVSADINPSLAVNLTLGIESGTSSKDYGLVANTFKRCESITTDTTANKAFVIYLRTNGLSEFSAQIRNINIFDLTQMFGSTIADYIYSLEQAHAGDGVAWFKALFGEDYYPYNAGELMSVKTSARKTYNADNVEIGSYALDDALELRGIPKLDSNNELYYDGDTYASDGTVTRKYGTVTFDGSETWYWDSNNALARTIVTGGIITNGTTQYETWLVDDNAELISTSWAGRTVNDGTMGMYYGQSSIFVKKSTITSANDAKTYFTNNPTNVIYALATPTTESADAYTQSQRVGATEEFVDGRTVEIPVGHNSLYYDGTPEITVTNAGNAISKPILTIYGSGDITVSLNSNQIFSIALGDYEYITIDTNAMEAYMGGVLLNRLVTGDYADFSLAVGDNTLSFTGNVSEVLIENYSRWI